MLVHYQQAWPWILTATFMRCRSLCANGPACSMFYVVQFLVPSVNLSVQIYIRIVNISAPNYVRCTHSSGSWICFPDSLQSTALQLQDEGCTFPGLQTDLERSPKSAPLGTMIYKAMKQRAKQNGSQTTRGVCMVVKNMNALSYQLLVCVGRFAEILSSIIVLAF